MIAPEPIKKRIPVGGWILGLTFLCVAALLLLPNGKQKRITLARKKLETDFRLSPSLNNVLNQVQSERVILPGKRDGFLIWYFWTPRSSSVVGSSLAFLPRFANSIRKTSMSGSSRFEADSIIVASLDDPAANTLATAFLVWGDKREWAERLDAWRVKYDKMPSSVRTTIESELRKLPTSEIKSAQARLAKCRAAIAPLNDLTQVFIDSSGRRFEVKYGLEWDFQNQYEMADLANRQADR